MSKLAQVGKLPIKNKPKKRGKPKEFLRAIAGTFLTIAGVFIILTTFYCISVESFVIWHEDAHSKIYEYHGYNNLTINYTKNALGFISGGYITCNDRNVSNPTVTMLHSQNEIVGYHMRAFINVVFLALLAWSVIFTSLYYSR